MLRCEICGVETTTRSKISTADGDKMVCSQCYNDFTCNEKPLDIPAKPTFIRFYKVKFAKMGTYAEDPEEIRYVLSIPKARKEEFEFEDDYDIIFIRRAIK